MQMDMGIFQNSQQTTQISFFLIIFLYHSTGNAWKITGDSNWVTEVIINETFKVFETTLNGELRVKFGYKPNF